MTHMSIDDLPWPWSANGSIKKNFKPTSCSPVFWSSNPCAATTVLRGLKQPGIAKATAVLQNHLCAGGR